MAVPGARQTQDDQKPSAENTQTRTNKNSKRKVMRIYPIQESTEI